MMGIRNRLALVIAVSACGKINPIEVDAAIDAPVLPEISAVTPPAATITASLTITGVRFGDVQGAGKVTIGGTPAMITSWSDTSIVAAVPDKFPAAAPVVVTNDYGDSEP